MEKCLSLSPPPHFPPTLLCFDRFSQNLVPCTVSCSEQSLQCSCSWDIGQQRIYNITLTVENALGRKTATEAFDVAHRSKAISISLLKVFVEGLVFLLILVSGCQFEVEVCFLRFY